MALDACLRGLALKPDHAPLRALELKASAAKAADDAASAAATPPAPVVEAPPVVDAVPDPPKAFEHSARKPVAVKAWYLMLPFFLFFLLYATATGRWRLDQACAVKDRDKK